jgi:hypothetical protein
VRLPNAIPFGVFANMRYLFLEFLCVGEDQTKLAEFLLQRDLTISSVELSGIKLQAQECLTSVVLRTLRIHLKSFLRSLWEPSIACGHVFGEGWTPIELLKVAAMCVSIESRESAASY